MRKKNTVDHSLEKQWLRVLCQKKNKLTNSIFILQSKHLFESQLVLVFAVIFQFYVKSLYAYSI